MKPCLYCGKDTTNPKYCSLSCGAKAQPRPKLERIVACRVCGTEFNNVRVPSKVYCSRSCAVTFNNRIKPKVTSKLPKLDCRNCHKKLKPGRVYCSKDCEVELHHSEQLRLALEEGSIPQSYLAVRRLLVIVYGHKCAICGISEWIGNPVPVVVDHIDGHADNHVWSNVRLVCGNCDMLLPTYKARNIGNGRHSRRQRYADGVSY